jgi:transposase-like protein
MPWRCPACGTTIHHRADEKTPREHIRYRCHVCRVSLEYHAGADKLIIVADDDRPKQK